jgi:hypothetical protein
MVMAFLKKYTTIGLDLYQRNIHKKKKKKERKKDI